METQHSTITRPTTTTIHHVSATGSTHPSPHITAQPVYVPLIDTCASDLATTYAVLLSLSVVFVTARIWSRSLLPDWRFWWDDWFVLANLILFIAQYGLYYLHIAIVHVDGQTDLWGSVDNVHRALKIRYGLGFFRPVLLGLPKLSTLLFYLRVFAKQQGRRWKQSWWLIMALSIVWIISGLVVTLNICIPIRKIWEPMRVSGHCINTKAWYLGGTIGDVITDVLILLLPVPLLVKMQLPLRRKLGVMVLFLCGYAAVAASIARLLILLAHHDNLQSFTLNQDDGPGLLVVLEEGLGLIGICLPGAFFLLRRMYNNGLRSLFSMRAGGRRTSVQYSSGSDQCLREKPDESSREFCSSSMQESIASEDERNEVYEHIPLEPTCIAAAPSVKRETLSDQSSIIREGRYLDV